MSLYKIIVEEIQTGVIDKKKYFYVNKKYALNDYANILFDITTKNFECNKKIVKLIYNNKTLHQNTYEHENGYSIKLVDSYFNAKLWEQIDNETGWKKCQKTKVLHITPNNNVTN